MIRSVVNRFLGANTTLHAARRASSGSSKTILVNATYLDPFAVVSIMKIATAAAGILEGRILVLPHFKRGQWVREIMSSYLPYAVLPIRYLLLRAFLRNMCRILRLTLRLGNGRDVANLSDGNLNIGIHIYDSMLKRLKLSSIQDLTAQHKLQAAFDLVYYFAMKDLFERYPIDFVVMPDNTYRDGLTYELMKARILPCIVGIDLNGISIHKNTSLEDYGNYCRVPDPEIVHVVSTQAEALQAAERYAETRFSGKEMQHDTMRAFAAHKINITRSDIQQEYGFAPDRRIALVMAHIFCDAPHAFPGLLFQDFEDWLVQTCVRLGENPHIEFLVKEHPSASLYGEDGMAAAVLRKVGCAHRLLPPTINTRSLFTSVDVLVTCGGTGGMEFPCFGVPVLVGARPAYHQFPYVVCPSTREEYLRELDSLHRYLPLGTEAISIAKAVFYTIHVLLRVPKKNLGLGSQEYYMGANLDIEKFLEEMIVQCEHDDAYAALTRYLAFLLKGPYKNLYEYDALVQMNSGPTEMAWTKTSNLR